MSQVAGLGRDEIELSCGTVEYTDTGGSGPTPTCRCRGWPGW